jgi:hypothetical protein
VSKSSTGERQVSRRLWGLLWGNSVPYDTKHISQYEMHVKGIDERCAPGAGKQAEFGEMLFLICECSGVCVFLNHFMCKHAPFSALSILPARPRAEDHSTHFIPNSHHIYDVMSRWVVQCRGGEARILGGRESRGSRSALARADQSLIWLIFSDEPTTRQWFAAHACLFQR